jgi:polyisoprenyl-phosphate glycosyltransferase
MSVMTDRSLSVVVACYRDAGSIHEFYSRLRSILPAVTEQWEIIYVNDASPDDAEAILRELAADDPRLVVVNHTRNFGSQNAFLSGMRVARGDAVVLMDGDLQDPPRLIPSLVEKWLEGCPIVYGRRVKREESAFRQLAYRLFYRVFRRMARFEVPVDAGDFGLLDRRVVGTLLSDFPECLVFLRGLRAYTGFRSAAVDYVRERRFDGRSTNSLAGNLRWARLAVFSFSQKPLEYISVTAFACVSISFVMALLYLVAYLRAPSQAPSGFMTLLLAVVFLGGVQMVCLSILATYLGHIYDEVKRRPRFIVRDVIDRRPAGPCSDREPGPSPTES